MHIDLAAMQSPWLTWESLTWFGDSALLLPAGLVVGLALLTTRGARGLAPRWAVAFGSVGLLVLATKIAFIAWGIGSARLDFTGISGHSALSSVFWPVIGWLLTQKRHQGTRRAAVFFGVFLAFAIGYSRLALEVHSVSEVISGLVVGFIASGWFLRGVRRPPTATPIVVAVVLVIGVLVLLGHGRPAPTTALIETTVVRILKVHAPFTRHDLHLRGF